ncbi:MAG: exodeoxyribonuclease V subunit alpha [Rhodocyclaceae bacterium]
MKPTAPRLAALIDTLRDWSDSGLLRHLDSAFARFIVQLDPTNASPALAVAAALLAHMEGRGHSCLPLTPLANDPHTLLGWPAEAIAQFLALPLESPDTVRAEPVEAHPPQSPSTSSGRTAKDASAQETAREGSSTGSKSTLPTRTADWLAALQASPLVQRIGHDPALGQPLVIDGPEHAPRLYLRRYWHYERSVAQAILARAGSAEAVDEARVRSWLTRLFPAPASAPPTPTPASAVDWQQLACAIALRARLAIVTGGPGTGKTYTAARLLALLFATHAEPHTLRIALAAPTGKAAARLRQAIDGSLQALQDSLGSTLDLTALTQRIGAARTLHSLLGARPDTRRFRHHAGHPLDVDVVIVDEASMVHLEMMAALLDALPTGARLILLGDKDQLASVEAGAVLGDLCRDAAAGRYAADTARYLQATTGIRLPAPYLATDTPAPVLAQQTVMLRESRRFHGPIGALALAVNDARDPALPTRLLHEDCSGALHALEKGTPADVIALALDGREGNESARACYRDYLQHLAAGPASDSPEAHARWTTAILNAFDRFRILCAVREGEWGVSGLNQAIEQALARARLLAPHGTWYAGRPVMVTHNDAALGVFNGDIGIALPAPGHGSQRVLRVYFLDGDTLRSVAVSRLAHVETAFAMTVHKSQGSEFEHTSLILSAHSGAVLSRELVYTGITRARKAFTLITEHPGLLETGVSHPTRRESGLLREE